MALSIGPVPKLQFVQIPAELICPRRLDRSEHLHLVLDFFAHNGGPNQLFSVPGPAKLIFELLAAIMATVIGRQFAAGIAFLITKNHLDLMLQQLTHQSGGDRTGSILDQKHRNVTKVHLGGALCIRTTRYSILYSNLADLVTTTTRQLMASPPYGSSSICCSNKPVMDW